MRETQSRHEAAEWPDEAEVRAGHLSETVSTRGLWILAALLVVGLALAVGLAGGIAWFYTGRSALEQRRALEAELPRDLPAAGTAHWINPARDLAVLRRQQQARLRGYAWVDREQGTVRIPIEVAMEIVAARDEQGSPDESTQPPVQGGGR